MRESYLFTVLIFGALTVLHCRNVYEGEYYRGGNDRLGNALNCNIYDQKDVKKFNRNQCSSIRVTSAFPGVDGKLFFSGLTRNKTAGMYINYLSAEHLSRLALRFHQKKL